MGGFIHFEVVILVQRGGRIPVASVAANYEQVLVFVKHGCEITHLPVIVLAFVELRLAIANQIELIDLVATGCQSHQNGASLFHVKLVLEQVDYTKPLLFLSFTLLIRKKFFLPLNFVIALTIIKMYHLQYLFAIEVKQGI